MLGCSGELFPREARDSLVRSLVLRMLCFYCSFPPSLETLQFIISTQSSISLPSVIVKLVLPSLILEDGSFRLLWGMPAQSDMNLACHSSSGHTAARLGGSVIYLGGNNAWCSPSWILFWKNSIYRLFVSLPSFYLHSPKYLVGVPVVITAINSISSKNQNWFTF